MVYIQKNLTVIAFLFFIVALTLVMCGKVPIKKRSLVVMEGDGNRDMKDQKSRPSKRTFCNAFTGCQGKRSDPSASMKDYDYGHESGKEAMEENSIDDVARDILAKAELWETFQPRNPMRYPLPLMRRQGFFGREKRATYADDESLEGNGAPEGVKKHE